MGKGKWDQTGRQRGQKLKQKRWERQYRIKWEGERPADIEGLWYRLKTQRQTFYNISETERHHETNATKRKMRDSEVRDRDFETRKYWDRRMSERDQETDRQHSTETCLLWDPGERHQTDYMREGKMFCASSDLSARLQCTLCVCAQRRSGRPGAGLSVCSLC